MMTNTLMDLDVAQLVHPILDQNFFHSTRVSKNLVKYNPLMDFVARKFRLKLVVPFVSLLFMIIAVT